MSPSMKQCTKPHCTWDRTQDTTNLPTTQTCSMDHSHTYRNTTSTLILTRQTSRRSFNCKHLTPNCTNHTRDMTLRRDILQRYIMHLTALAHKSTQSTENRKVNQPKNTNTFGWITSPRRKVFDLMTIKFNKLFPTLWCSTLLFVIMNNTTIESNE